MINKKLHWTAVISFMLSVLSLLIGTNTYISKRDPNQFPELNAQTIGKNDTVKASIQDYSRAEEVFTNTKSSKKLDIMMVTTKDNFKFLTLVDSYVSINKGNNYLFNKTNTYSGLTAEMIQLNAADIFEIRQDLPVLYFVGSVNQEAESTIIGTVAITAVLATIGIFSFIYSREIKRIVINGDQLAAQIK